MKALFCIFVVLLALATMIISLALYVAFLHSIPVFNWQYLAQSTVALCAIWAIIIRVVSWALDKLYLS